MKKFIFFIIILVVICNNAKSQSDDNELVMKGIEYNNSIIISGNLEYIAEKYYGDDLLKKYKNELLHAIKNKKNIKEDWLFRDLLPFKEEAELSFYKNIYKKHYIYIPSLEREEDPMDATLIFDGLNITINGSTTKGYYSKYNPIYMGRILLNDNKIEKNIDYVIVQNIEFIKKDNECIIIKMIDINPSFYHIAAIDPNKGYLIKNIDTYFSSSNTISSSYSTIEYGEEKKDGVVFWYAKKGVFYDNYYDDEKDKKRKPFIEKTIYIKSLAINNISINDIIK